MTEANWTKAVFFDNITNKICRPWIATHLNMASGVQQNIVSLEKTDYLLLLNHKKHFFVMRQTIIDKSHRNSIISAYGFIFFFDTACNYDMKFDAENVKQKKCLWQIFNAVSFSVCQTDFIVMNGHFLSTYTLVIENFSRFCCNVERANKVKGKQRRKCKQSRHKGIEIRIFANCAKMNTSVQLKRPTPLKEIILVVQDTHHSVFEP